MILLQLTLKASGAAHMSPQRRRSSSTSLLWRCLEREKMKEKLKYLSSFLITRVFEEACAKFYSLKFRQQALVEPQVSLEKTCAKARERAERSASEKNFRLLILQRDKICYPMIYKTHNFTKWVFILEAWNKFNSTNFHIDFSMGDSNDVLGYWLCNTSTLLTLLQLTLKASGAAHMSPQWRRSSSASLLWRYLERSRNFLDAF
uniref:Myosin-17 isoform X1 n=1 Tax=Tanacetum cinerariifolium TaxID=118510 RepID=A0A699I3Q2_TANCI|nr:myosin-17 isoform X1 [Tanacetum cinerariifolium]